eukprot:TRINITY_DN7959_c0_g2_i1.p1 TRINITY_DN7959_c0_g2~~TRINITY_DN7959_c0_g2_i1.p1  ORF type:complete len:317 (+),score=59.06 TRINITY_DN7959_c0_g2_i1:204-1154(+)
MKHQLEIASNIFSNGQRKSLTFKYEAKFQTPTNFQKEIEQGFGKKDPKLTIFDNGNEEPIAFERLHLMMVAADEEPSALDSYGYKDGILQLNCKFDSRGVVKQINNEENLGNDKFDDVKARVLMPRVCNAYLAEKTGLPLDFYITEKASRNLPSNLKLKYNECQKQVDGLEAGQHRRLNRYICNCNAICKAEGQQWRKSKRGQVYYLSSKLWRQKYAEDFLNIEDDDEQDDDEAREDRPEYPDVDDDDEEEEEESSFLPQLTKLKRVRDFIDKENEYEVEENMPRLTKLDNSKKSLGKIHDERKPLRERKKLKKLY